MPYNLKLDFNGHRLNKRGYQDEGREDSRLREGRPEKKQKAIDSARVAREARARNKARR